MFKNSLTKALIGFTIFSIIAIGKTYAYEEEIIIKGLSGDRGTGNVGGVNWDVGYTPDVVQPIQSFTQIREDLNLIFLDNNGNINEYTLMDRNMGATEVYNKEFDLWYSTPDGIEIITSPGEVNRESFGYQYIWGNNYGFKPCYTSGCNNFPGGEISTDHNIYYNSRRGLLPDGKFANNVWFAGYNEIDPDEGDCRIYTLRDMNYPQSRAIRVQQIMNLRGGFDDTKTTNGNSTLNRYQYQDNNGNISRGCETNEDKRNLYFSGLTKTIKDSRTSSRQGPCPSGYHIPSIAEWTNIINSRRISRNRAEIGNNKSDVVTKKRHDNSWGAKLASDLLLPPVGERSRGDYNSEYYQGIAGFYRSSSPFRHSDIEEFGVPAHLLSFTQLEHSTDCGDGSCMGLDRYGPGLPIRCIKDNTNSVKVYPNGGTNAVIGIDGYKITTLSTPSRDGCEFGGRYTDSDFSEYNVISEGDEIYDDTTLYAKWIGENCGRTNTQQQNCTSLPKNAQWINSKFTQTWDGISWTPSSYESTYTSDNNIECSFQCNTNYSRDTNTQECIFNGNGGGDSDSYKCTDLPENATANNSEIPEDSDKKYSYSTNTGEICTFQCNNNYTRNNFSEKCIANRQENNCTSLPANAYWINSKFIQTWNGTSRAPTSHENTYSSDNNIECSFLCNTNYSRNASSKICEYKGSGGGGGGGGGDGGNSSKNDNYIYLLTNRKSPSTNQFINLTIETDDDYTGKIKFSKFQYKSSSSSSRSTISNKISNTYISDYSDTWEDGYYKMTSSDNGYVTLKNLVKFKKSGYYKIYVEDKYGNSKYIQFNVNSDSGSYGENSYLKVRISPSNPDTYAWIKLTIETDDDYTGKIKFSKFQYKSSSSSSRSTISNKISNTYISDYSDSWENGYYKMTSSDKGEATLKNLIKFKKNGYYKIYVEDTDDNESSVEFTVNSSTYNNGNETNYEKDDIEDKINNLLNGNGTTKNDSSSPNITSNTTTTNTYPNSSQITQNTNYGNDIYISRSCKPYTIYYITSLNAYTSPDLKKTEYFVNIDYFKKYVDSKNAQNIECHNGGWINSPYIDNYTGSDRITAPNGKIYFINQQNGSFTSNQLTTSKSFSTINEIKTYIKKRNPLSNIN